MTDDAAAPLVSADEAGPLRAALQHLADTSEALFRDHFLLGKAVPAPPSHAADFARFEAAGLCRRKRRTFTPSASVFPFFGHFVATDRSSRKALDQVFPLTLEQIYLVRNLDVRAGDRVLELCLGSGANTLVAADAAEHVVGIDVSPRALAFATFNARLNGVTNVDLRQGDLYAPLHADERFDLVFVNPPFELVPPGSDWFLHSHGGADGLDVVRRILDGLPAILAPEGRFAIVTWSPGSETSIALVPLLQAALPSHHIVVHHLDRAFVEAWCDPFEKEPGYADWQRDLEDRGLTHAHFVFVSAHPAEAGHAEEIDPVDEYARCMALVRAWD